MRGFILIILCLTSCVPANRSLSETATVSAWSSSVHGIRLGMSRQHVEKLLVPAKDTGLCCMYSGGQLSDYATAGVPKVSVWYDYTGATSGKEGWLQDGRNDQNRVVSVLFDGKKLIGKIGNITSAEQIDAANGPQAGRR